MPLVPMWGVADDPRVSMDFKPEGPGGDRLEETEGGAPSGERSLAQKIAVYAGRALLLLFFGSSGAEHSATLVPPPATRWC